MLTFDLIIDLARIFLHQSRGQMAAVYQLIRLQPVLLQAGLQRSQLFDIRHSISIVGQPDGGLKSIIEFLD